MKNIKNYNSFVNEDIRQYLKPKSEEKVRNAMKKIDSMNDFDKMNYILDNNLLFLLSKEEFKQMMNTLPPDEQISYIFEHDLKEEYYTDEEIKELLNKVNPIEQISLIGSFSDLDVFGRDYLKNIVYNYGDSANDRLDLIYQRFSDELGELFTDQEIKNIVNGKDEESENKLDNIELFGLNGAFTKKEIRNIINNIKDPYLRLHCVYVYGHGEYFTNEEIIKMFNKLNDVEKNNILDHDELYNILPKEIIEKYE